MVRKHSNDHCLDCCLPSLPCACVKSYLPVNANILLSELLILDLCKSLQMLVDPVHH